MSSSPPRSAERLLESLPAAVYVIDLVEQRLIYLNSGAVHALGFENDELLRMGSRLDLLMHPEDWPRFLEHLERMRDSGDREVVNFEYRLRTKDGSWRWYRGHDVVLDRDDSGRAIRHVGIATDITENHRLERERDRLASIVEAASDFIAVTRPDGGSLYANRAARQFVGWDERDDVTGVRIAQFHSDEDARRIFDEAMPVAARGETARIEIELRHRDGHRIPVSMSLNAHRDRSGRLAYFSTIMRDISREKQATVEIERLCAALRTEAQRRSEGLGAARRDLEARSRSLARGLGEPVDELRGATERLAVSCRSRLDEGGRQTLDAIEGGVRRLAALRDKLARGEDPR